MPLRVSRVQNFKCDHCEQMLEAGTASALSKVVCPKCGGETTVPARLHDLILQRRIKPSLSGEYFRGLEEPLGREVEIHVLESETGASGAAVGACLRLHKVLARLDHPYIARVHRLIPSEDHPVLVLETRGASVVEYLAKRQMGGDLILRLAQQAISALRAANAAGLVHMGLQPSRWLLRADATLSLSGFSLWNRLTTPPADGGWPLLNHLAFTPPEVLKGQRPDIRSDIWSFGACLLYMVARREAQSHLEIPALYREIRDDMSESLAGALPRCLEPNPAKRAESWDEVQAFLVEHTQDAWSSSIADAIAITKRGKMLDSQQGKPPKTT